MLVVSIYFPKENMLDKKDDFIQDFFIKYKILLDLSRRIRFYDILSSYLFAPTYNGTNTKIVAYNDIQVKY